ncbi:MAG: ankyrin repeat domain-containing protein [Thermodesulfobacteriota bacterium]
MRTHMGMWVAVCFVLFATVGLGPAYSDEDTDYALLQASAKGDLEQARRLLDKGSSPDCMCGPLSPLILAAHHGHAKVVGLLLARGAEIDKRGVNGPSALVQASARGQVELVKLLLDQGADFKLKAAFVWKEIKLTGDKCRDLDKVGAVQELCVQDDCCMTALCVAADEKIKDLLMKHGAKE